MLPKVYIRTLWLISEIKEQCKHQRRVVSLIQFLNLSDSKAEAEESSDTTYQYCKDFLASSLD